MKASIANDYARLGIERVAVVELTPVSHVDLMTRSAVHASSLAAAVGIRPFSFTHGRTRLHAFPRVPALPARRWLEAQGIPFEVTADKLGGGGQPTWVQAGFAVSGRCPRA